MSATTTDEFHQASHLLSGYRTAPGTFDELLTPDGQIKPAWQPVLAAFARMSEEERRAAQDSARRSMKENSVTFAAADDPDGTRRPWLLDLFPMLIAPQEWQTLRAGLIQRARLLNEILGDLYGPQRCLREGTLPSSVVFANPRFLPACHGIPVRGDQHLHFLAFDIARSPDGRWWVLSDRTEAPSGAGYALENRVVGSRSLPEIFGGLHVERQASFFRSFREHFMSLSQRDEPLAVLLSRGPSKRMYFEHAYLARYLGYNIVEGSDLTVRDERLFLKTIDGLQPVDLVLRTIRSDMADPLELRTDSSYGVPGLLQAVRAGRVTMANALGSGLIESDALLSFLPNLSRYFLSEDLKIPSVATWWCGQRAEQQYVLDNLESLVIKRISSARSFLSVGQETQLGDDMSTEQRISILSQIKRGGYDFVGQEALSLSTAPVWHGNELQPAPVVLRMFVAATANGYEVLPGALTRVSVGTDPQAAWLEAGDVSKDTWVLSDEPVETYSLIAQRLESANLRRSISKLPSRAADNLFWLGRYAERGESAVRLLRALVGRLHGEIGGHRALVSPERLISLLVFQKYLSARRGKAAISGGRDAVEKEFWSILFEATSREGLAAVLRDVRRTADVVRERLSFDAFRVLTELTHTLESWAHNPNQEIEDALRMLNRMIQYLSAFAGMIMENMTRGHGWRFLDMGRRIERVRSMIQLVQQLTVRGNPEPEGSLDLLLELADSTMTYRGRYQASPQLPRVLDLLLADETNPRSILFQVLTIDEHLTELPAHDESGLLDANRKITTRLAGDLRLLEAHAMSDTVSRFGARTLLDRLCKQIEAGVEELSNNVSQTFFSHSTPTRVASGSSQGIE